MKWTKKMKGAGKKAAVTVTALGMVLTAFPPIPAKAAEEFAGQLTSVESVEKGSMTEVTGFRQSVRLFWSRDPVTPSILSSFLLHLSDALPSGRVLLRLSVSTLALTVLLRCRLF